MDQDNIRLKMEELAEMERSGSADVFNALEVYVDKYKEHFGCDQWINTFVSEYLEDRHHKFYEANKAKYKVRKNYRNI